MVGPLGGYTPLTVVLDLDENPWVELQDTEFRYGMATHVGVLPDGTNTGKPSIAIRGLLEDGTEVVLQTTWNLLYTTARAIEARYGEAK